MQTSKQDKLLMRIILIFFIVIVLWLQYRLWFADDGIFKAFRLKKEIKAKQENNRKIEEHNIALVNEIESLKKGGEAIENRARSDLGMVKKGEVFYQVVK